MNDDAIIPTRRSLLSRLKDWDDQESWRDFFDTYWKLIYRVATKAGLSDAEAQDVVQETVLSVAKKMPDFQYDAARGSFKGWLLQLTRWRILNVLKKRPREKLSWHRAEDSDRTPTAERVADPASLNWDACWETEWQENLMGAALDRLKLKVNARHYQVFYLHVLKQQSAAEVAGTLRVNVAQVYLIKQRLSAALKREVRALERHMI